MTSPLAVDWSHGASVHALIEHFGVEVKALFSEHISDVCVGDSDTGCSLSVCWTGRGRELNRPGIRIR